MATLKAMQEHIIHDKLLDLYTNAEIVSLDKGDRVVIFSDLHMGNGSSGDDFTRNGELFLNILANYYLNSDFKLILNGDVEELQRYTYEKIRKRWSDVYSLFKLFDSQTALYKLYGNHDSILHSFGPSIPNQITRVIPALKLEWKGNIFFIFHGHQASYYYERFNMFAGVILKYVAQPLRIKNFSVAHNSLKKYRIERRVYDFSNRQKIVSIIGHTHRPLFESLSKKDYLRFKIENLCREYPRVSRKAQLKIEETVLQYKNDLDIIHNSKRGGEVNTLYSRSLLVPSLFNSGCTIGKRGLTAIEIADSTIQLVHWFDTGKIKKSLSQNGSTPLRLKNSSAHRLILKEDDIRYIFSRIKLLT